MPSPAVRSPAMRRGRMVAAAGERHAERVRERRTGNPGSLSILRLASFAPDQGTIELMALQLARLEFDESEGMLGWL